MDRRKKTYLILVILIVTGSILLLCSLFYSFFGHVIVKDIYEGKFFIGPLNTIIGSQEIHSLDHYLDKADIVSVKFKFLIFYVMFSAILLILMEEQDNKIKVFVFLFGAGIAMNSQFLSYLTPYVLNDDVRQHTWWMRQFQNNELFNNDLLAVYAKSLQPWGILALYYPLSFIVDPVMLGKILPPVLLGISSVYFYKIIQHVTKDHIVSVAGALIYSITPVFLRQMVGGHARAFAFPLAIIFMYYLIRKDYLKAFLLIALQALFYPMVAILSGLTYLLSFIGVTIGGLKLDICRKKVVFFVLAFLVSSGILLGKQYLSHTPEVGQPVSRSEAEDKIEFYNERWPLLPTPAITQEIEANMEKGLFFFRSLRKKTGIKAIHRLFHDRRVFLIVVLLLVVILVLIRRTILIPKEIYYLLISGILMYRLADILFLKLYSPRRYLEYSAPLVSAFIFAFMVAAVLLSIRHIRVKRCVQVCVFALIILNFNIANNEALIDMSGDKELYAYLAGIPVNSVVAAHPDLADGIPTFSKRKVFIAKDISVPLYGAYWESVKGRTFDFFKAYYSNNAAETYDFCVRNNIDYIVVDEKDFGRDYINKGVYFEPFSSFVRDLTRDQESFALEEMPDKYKIYKDGNIFIIKREDLKKI